MPRSLKRMVACLLIAAPVAGLEVGCGPDNIKLVDAPPVAIPPAKKVTELPKNQRPAAGSSAGMNYNPLTGQPD